MTGKPAPGDASQQRAPNDIRSRCTKNDDGEWVLERKSTRGGTGNTHEVNITRLFGRAGHRTTANSFILQVEHENIESGKSVGNPAEPISGTAIPHVVTASIRALSTVDEVQAFVDNEIEHGPRQYVIGLANERKAELDGGGENG